MSQTFIQLEESPRRQRFSVNSMYMPVLLESRMSPLEQAHKLKELAYANVNHHKRPTPKDLEVSVAQSPYADIYYNHYKDIDCHFKSSSVNVKNIINKYQRHQYRRPQTISPDNGNSLGETIIKSPRLRPQTITQDFRQSFSIKGKTYYKESTFRQTLYNFKQKMKSILKAQRSQEPAKVLLNNKVNIQNISSRYRNQDKPDYGHVQKIIDKCDSIPKQKYHMYHMDNKKYQSYFMVSEDRMKGVEFDPYKSVRVQLRENAFLNRTYQRIEKSRQLNRKQAINNEISDNSEEYQQLVQ